ncbi:MAG: hypothetical protein AAB691_01465 [Patescibacteria group bacterium]|mgnify:FL=1
MRHIAHYYGDTVRRLFVLGAIIMILTLPFFVDEIGQPLIIPLGVILATGIAAGLTSPQNTWSALLNVCVAAGGVIGFEWYAVDWYARYGREEFFFWTSQTLAAIFLLALYFSLKTIRMS